ncbi:PRODH [Lepeophtheirus salmonis]|uniref:Proline dehydrogenase 1, mitochondrial n=2 Tax=Lepeophtheirus salmonis TaxID=72036 RepID=A0A7R8CII6_LEPSM|nr:PRODH [Lepeophtheirus salmonis]CAF2829457.1 PRODH [Lepeophtheirus salmonis]
MAIHRIPRSSITSVNKVYGVRVQERVPIRYLHSKRSTVTTSTSTTDIFADSDSKVITTNAGVKRRIDPLDTGFTNHSAAFKSKTTFEVLRGYIVLNLCSVGWIVNNNEQLMKLGKRVLGKPLFAKIMKYSFYGHFVAGENRQTIKPVIHRMHTFGVKSILDYSVEEDISEAQARKREMEACNVNEEFTPEVIPQKGTHRDHIRRYQAHVNTDRRANVTGARTYFYQNEAQCEKNMETFLRCIEAVADSTHKTGLAAIKMTALGRPNLLLQLSECIIRARRYYEFVKRFKENQIYDGNDDVQRWLSNMTSDRKGLIHLFSWSGLIDANLLLKDVFKVPNLKTGKLEPLITALSLKEEEQFRNMLSRLQTIFQAAKDLDVRVMVDAEQNLFPTRYISAHHGNDEKASRQNFYFGAKLVRGAYMEQERARAKDVGYDDPINPSYDATNFSRIGIMVASHNADTVRFAINKMKELNINQEDRLICFGQLYGMCDQLSFPLGQSGYSVYKYVPYGPESQRKQGHYAQVAIGKDFIASRIDLKSKKCHFFTWGSEFLIIHNINMENEEDLSLMVDRAFTVRAIYLKPRELIPFPASEFYPCYDYESHPKYPIPVKQSKEIFSGYVPVVENSSSSVSTSFSAPSSSSYTKINLKATPNDVARFETVASEPLIPLFQQTPQTKLVIPPPVTRPFIILTMELSTSSKQQMLILPSSQPSGTSYSPSSPEESLELTSTINIKSSNTSNYFQNQYLEHEYTFYNQQSQSATPLPPQQHQRKQFMNNQQQHNLYFQFADKSQMNRSCEKILTNANYIDLTPSPTSSSLGLTQIKALYEERHKKSNRGNKKKPSQEPIFSDSQSADMLRVFRQTPYISAKQRSQMAQHLEIPEETISVWFKNQRSKMKKKMSLYSGNTVTTSVIDG